MTNDLPPTADKSWSWYRRVFRVVFPNTFKDGKSIVETIPEEEYENFLLKCLKMIPTMLEIGKFTNEKTREEKKLDYERASNRVIEFAEKFCEKVEGCETATYKMCEVFNKKFCPEFGAKEISKEEFNNRLEDAGFEIETKRFDEKDSSGKRKQHMQKFVKSLKLKGVANTEEGELMSPNAILMSALKLFDEEIVSRSITTEPSPLVCGEIFASIIKKMGGEIGNKALGEKTIAIEGAVRNIILIRGWKWNPTIVNPQIVTAASL